MPSYAVIKLSKIGSSAFTATVGPQLCAEDADHALATGIGGPGAGHGLGVHRANLVVMLQAGLTFGVVVADAGDVLAGHLLIIGPAPHVEGPAHALGLLCADRMKE